MNFLKIFLISLLFNIPTNTFAVLSTPNTTIQLVSKQAQNPPVERNPKANKQKRNKLQKVRKSKRKARLLNKFQNMKRPQKTNVVGRIFFYYVLPILALIALIIGIVAFVLGLTTGQKVLWGVGLGLMILGVAALSVWGALLGVV